MSRIRTNQITNQSADGAPTVQNGLVISGVTTSTTFSGSGASLTNLPSAQLTGALPALDGSNLTGISAGTSLSGSTNNTVCTVTGANAIQGESNVHIDSNGRLIIGDTAATNTFSGGDDLVIGNTSSGTRSGLSIVSHSAQDGGIYFSKGTSTDSVRGQIVYQHDSDGGYMRLYTNANERLRILANGGVGINTSNFSSSLNNEVGLAIHGESNDNCRIVFTTPTKSNPPSAIGYFGLNRLGIDCYDGVEIRDVTASYATRFKIDQNGYMTTNQPYGYVRFNVHNDTGGEQRQTSVYTHTVENGMSHSGGRLTVPATGKYYIGIHGNVLDNNGAAQYLYKNGSKQAGFNWQQNDSDSYWKSSMVGGIVSLTANDYLDIYVVGKQDNHSWNMWTVYMIG